MALPVNALFLVTTLYLNVVVENGRNLSSCNAVTLNTGASSVFIADYRTVFSCAFSLYVRNFWLGARLGCFWLTVYAFTTISAPESPVCMLEILWLLLSTKLGWMRSF